ncbi:MAG: hypothetical protein GOMPHAMPRED_001603 [Gomphillus americanus]|uniref:Nephrocystin 3-like N-terminal domain-containing protein n=1 Tax=Gomphillus americanus TaxID=1940652 RepID=A0A8H3IFB8_9LECA|nr:MAG: hypothetical protein GOMPHAMPRED_001603 [Gomphillus americanus]
MPVLPTTVRRLYDTCSENSSRPPSANIKDAFYEVASSLQNVYIVIDALDESQTTNGLRRALLVELLKLSELGNVKILVTSRPLPDILNTLKNIAKYVTANFPNLPAFVGRQPTLQNELKEAIVAASNGIFLLTTLYTQSLVGSRSPRYLRRKLQSFSHGASGYNEAYTKTMARICGQVQDQKELAIETLMWVVYAERLLTCGELVHVLATEPDDSVFQDDKVPDIEDVLSACCGLLILEEKTSLAFLEHLIPNYLELCQSTPGVTGLHLVAYHGLVELLPPFLERYDVNSIDKFHNTALSYAIQRNRKGAARLLIDNGVRLDIPDKKAGQKMNIYKGADFLCSDKNGCFPLVYAVEVGNGTALEFLINLASERGDSDGMRLRVCSRDKDGLTPLMCAARTGYQSALDLLLENGASVDDYDDKNMTALTYAITRRWEDSALRLLRSGARCNVAKTKPHSLPNLQALFHPKAPPPSLVDRYHGIHPRCLSSDMIN